MKQHLKALGAWLAALPFRSKQLVIVCYVVFFAASLLAGVWGGVQDGILRAAGRLQQQTVAMDDFELVDLACVEGDVYVSTSYDPRMILLDTPTLVRRVTIRAEFLNREPGEFCVFYMPHPDMEEFDARYRVWAHVEDDGTYTFDIPAGHIYGLRIDPGIYSGIEIDFESIELNAPQSFFSRFTPTRPWLLAFLVVPPLAASAVQYLAQVVRRLRNGLRTKKGA